MLPNWGVFQIFLTIAELAVGIGLLFGIATRLAALGGILLILPIWLMLFTPTSTSGPTRSTCSRCCCSRPGRRGRSRRKFLTKIVGERWPF